MRWTFFEIRSNSFRWMAGRSDRSTCHAANGSPGTLSLNFERNLCVTVDAPESVHVAFA